jgi:hypothetical protein
MKMAKAPEMTVTVERAAHDAMRDVAQSLWDKHGLRIDDVTFRWIHSIGCSGEDYHLAGIDIRSGTSA